MKQKARAWLWSPPEKKLRSWCRRAVIRLYSCRPITKKDKRRDTAFGITMAVLWFLVPLVAIPWLAVLDRGKLLIAVLLSSYALSALLASLRVRGILRKFYRVERADSLLEVREGKEYMKELCEDAFTLLFPLPPVPPVLKLISTWLVRRGLMQEGEKLPIYHLLGRDAAPYLSVSAEEDAELLLIPLGERRPDNWQRFRRELFELRGEIMERIAKEPERKNGQRRKRLEETVEYAALMPDKETVDIYLNGQAVRVGAGSGGSFYTLADTKPMFWLLPEERAGQELSEEERRQVIEQVAAAEKGKSNPVVFLTEELKERAYALAIQIQEKKLSVRKAQRLLEKSYPDLPEDFLREALRRATYDAK